MSPEQLITLLKTTVTVDEFGIKTWCVDGKLHRENGPAVIGKDGYKAWWVNGERHRENGPAIICARSGIPVWFLNDWQYTEAQFNNEIQKKYLHKT